MASAEPGAAGRVANGRCLCRLAGAGKYPARDGGDGRHRGGAIEEIAPRDGSIHSQLSIAEVHSRSLAFKKGSVAADTRDPLPGGLGLQVD